MCTNYKYVHLMIKQDMDNTSHQASSQSSRPVMDVMQFGSNIYIHSWSPSRVVRHRGGTRILCRWGAKFCPYHPPMRGSKLGGGGAFGGGI